MLLMIARQDKPDNNRKIDDGSGTSTSDGEYSSGTISNDAGPLLVKTTELNVPSVSSNSV